MSEIHGYCAPRFNAVRELFQKNVESGEEFGASVYVNLGGEEVVDMWGGWGDRECTRPWNADSVVNVASASKNVTSLAVLMLVDRGLIDIDAPVATYWPEFAQNGKEGVEVRHLISHSAGLPAWEAPFTFSDAMDVPAATARLAAQAPWWRPGAFSSYHASTFGHLNGELVRRVCGKSLGAFIASEIAGPLDADFYLGVPETELQRIVTVYPSPEESKPYALPIVTPGSSEAERINAMTRAGSFGGTMGDPLAVLNSAKWRRTEFGGSSGHANARGLGRIMSVLSLGGTAQGVQLLSPETIDLIFEEQSDIVDPYYGKPIRWGIGYALAPLSEKVRGPLPFMRPGGRTCYWYGTGGSLAIADAERKLSIGYAMNRSRSGRSALNGGYYEAIYGCL
jgi:CubicO group peptidase (beta-lactamase class C family)